MKSEKLFGQNFERSTEPYARNHMELKRRCVELHYRRDRLERELQAINTALLILDKQMDRDKRYTKLKV